MIAESEFLYDNDSKRVPEKVFQHEPMAEAKGNIPHTLPVFTIFFNLEKTISNDAVPEHENSILFISISYLQDKRFIS